MQFPYFVLRSWNWSFIHTRMHCIQQGFKFSWLNSNKNMHASKFINLLNNKFPTCTIIKKNKKNIRISAAWEFTENMPFFIFKFFRCKNFLPLNEAPYIKIAVTELNWLSFRNINNLLLLFFSSFLALFAALLAFSSFSCSSRHRWKFSTTTPTNMFSTKKPTSSRKEMK